jgi:hypothetical protein
MGGVSQKRMTLIVGTRSKNLRTVGTMFALVKRRISVNRGIRPYQLSNSGVQNLDFAAKSSISPWTFGGCPDAQWSAPLRSTDS